MSQAIIVDVQDGHPDLEAILAGIVHTHASCIEHDHTIATFLPPLSYVKVLQYWRDRLDETKANTRRIWVELQPTSSRKAQLDSPLRDASSSEIILDQGQQDELEVAGVVSLYMPVSQTGPFRGEVHKLLVSPNHRQKGIARRLMTELERYANKAGRWQLMLDTEIGSPAELVYPRLGYIQCGIIPENGISPRDGKLRDEMFFYKDLRKSTL